MSKITWDALQDRTYELGVSKGVLYRPDEASKYTKSTPWNGLINVTENPSGADNNKLWADNIEYAALRAAETFGGSIEAYTYPPEFAECDGSAEIVPGVYAGQQTRKPFDPSNVDNIGQMLEAYAGLDLSSAGENLGKSLALSIATAIQGETGGFVAAITRLSAVGVNAMNGTTGQWKNSIRILSSNVIQTLRDGTATYTLSEVRRRKHENPLRRHRRVDDSIQGQLSKADNV